MTMRPIDAVRALWAAEPGTAGADTLCLTGLATGLPRVEAHDFATNIRRGFFLPAPIALWGREVVARFAFPMGAIFIKPLQAGEGDARQADLAEFWGALRNAERGFLALSAGVLQEGGEHLAILSLSRFPGWTADYKLWRTTPMVRPAVERGAHPAPGLQAWMSGIETFDVTGRIDGSAHARALLARRDAALAWTGSEP